MKIVSEEHFATMQNMALYFERRASTDEIYIAAAKASAAINKMIENILQPTDADFALIREILTNAFPDKYSDGSAWYDYKIHVAGTIRVNGADSSSIF